MWKIWLVLADIFLIIEIINMGFLVFWFSIGALIAMIASFFIDNVIIQSTIFLISSTILLFATRPFVNKFLTNKNFVKTNSASFEGKIGKVTADINPIESTGQVKVNGEVWSAKSYDNTFIAKGTEIIVEKIEGVKAIVKPLV